MATDPYRTCLKSCTHDLGRGALLHELLSGKDDPDYNPLDKILISPGAAWIAAARGIIRSPEMPTSPAQSSHQ